MRDLSLQFVARLALPLALATMTCTFIACEPGRGNPPAAQIEKTPVTIEPDDANTIPCGPRRVLQAVCQRCHQKPPINGAPFPLVTRSNIVRKSPDGEVRQLMIDQIEVGLMPLAPVTIDYNDRETLLDWLRAGAPAEPPHTCDEPADAAAATPDTGAPPPDAGDDDGGATPDDDTSPDASASD